VTRCTNEVFVTAESAQSLVQKPGGSPHVKLEATEEEPWMRMCEHGLSSPCRPFARYVAVRARARRQTRDAETSVAGIPVACWTWHDSAAQTTESVADGVKRDTCEVSGHGATSVDGRECWETIL
jgi:hypothetical protein